MLVAILSAQGIALLGAAAFLTIRTGGNGARSRTSALIEAALALVAALAFGLLARAVRPPGRPAAVTPTLVLEVLCLPVATGLVQSGRPELGLPLGLVALAAIFCLLTAGPTREAL